MVPSLERWQGKVAVVTGASAGIGAALCKRLVEEGLQVVGLARRAEKIEDLAIELAGSSGQLIAIKADVSKEEEVLEAFEWIKTNLGPVHILVNNAGIMKFGNLIDGETKLFKEILDVNVLGLCIATREALNNMKENGVDDGHIIHVNSLAGHHPVNMPGWNIYPASKYAVTALTETLRQELNRFGMKTKVTSISPGVVATELLDVGGMNPLPEGTSALTSEDVANAIIYALSTPPHVQVHELIIRPVGDMF